MAGVWVFDNGVARLVSNNNGRRQVLVYRPTNHVISSYAELEQKLHAVGWYRYPQEQPGTIQFHRGNSSNHLITLPRDARSLRPMHLLDIVMKIRDYFEVRDQ